MNLNEFKIGEFFWTGTGKWKCFDIGTKSIVATKWQTEIRHYTVSTKNGSRSEHRVVNPDDVQWYELDNVVFFDFDFDGCWATEEEYGNIINGR